MTAFPGAFIEPRPLPVEQLSPAGKQAIELLKANGYEVRAGLNPEFAQSIIKVSLETSIREYCPKDSSERFVDLKSIERWLAKCRGMFLLLKRSDEGNLNVAGYGWSGTASNQHVPGGAVTFALRIGEVGQGHGLATPFSRLILEASAILYGAQNIWLETWGSNGGAVHVYHKVGFVTVAEEPGHRQSVAGQKVDDTRIYMSLPNELLPRVSSAS